MPLQFRKRVKLAKGLYLNLSQSGVSMTVGTKGARMTIGNKGVTESYSLPGTGISYRKQHAWKHQQQQPAQPVAKAKESAFDNNFKWKTCRVLTYAITLFLWFLLVAAGDYSPLLVAIAVVATLYSLLLWFGAKKVKTTPPPLPLLNS